MLRLRAAQDTADFFYVALGIYEYLTTFSQEVQVVWKRKWTVTTVLLLTIRWAIVADLLFHFTPAKSEV